MNLTIGTTAGAIAVELLKFANKAVDLEIARFNALDDAGKREAAQAIQTGRNRIHDLLENVHKAVMRLMGAEDEP